MYIQSTNPYVINMQAAFDALAVSSGFSYYFGIYLIMGLAAIGLIVLNSMIKLFWRRREHEPRLTIWRFICQQSIIVAQYPMQWTGLVMFFGAAALIWPFTLVITYLISGEEGFSWLFNHEYLDFRCFAVEQRSADRAKEWKEQYGMIFQPHNWERSSKAYSNWQREIAEREANKADRVRRAAEWPALIGGYLMLAFLIATAPFAVFVKSAKAATKEQETVEQPVETEQLEKPFRPEPPKLSGSVIHQFSLADAFGSSEATWQFRMLALKVSGNVTERFSYFGFINFAAFAEQSPDPVYMATVTWTPNETITVTAGRLFLPVGYDRGTPPDQKAVAYASTALTSPVLDHGVMAKISVKSMAFSAGVVTGHGIAIEADNTPDVLMQLSGTYHKLTLGAAGQTGKQPTAWRHNASAYAVLDLKRLMLSAEATASRTPVEDDVVTAAGWWTLALWRPKDSVEVYGRVERLYDNNNVPPKLLLGANWRPKSAVALRPALEIPLEDDPEIKLHLATQIVF